MMKSYQSNATRTCSPARSRLLCLHCGKRAFMALTEVWEEWLPLGKTCGTPVALEARYSLLSICGRSWHLGRITRVLRHMC